MKKEHSATPILRNALAALGYSSHEVRVCLTLIERRVARASEIATAARLPRQTVYSILKRFIEKGLITATAKKGVRKFACDYRHVSDFVKREQLRLKRVAHSLETGLPPAVAVDLQARPLPLVTYYEGSLGLEHLFDSMLDQYKKGKYKTFRGYGINFLAKTYGLEEYLRYFLEKRAALGVKAKLFIAKGPDDFHIVDEKTRLNRDIKHLDIEEQNAGIYLVGNRLYLFSFKDNVGVMIENRSIAQFIASTFDDYWEYVE